MTEGEIGAAAAPETGARAVPYGFLGLIISLFAIIACTVLFCGLAFLILFLLVPLLPESEFANALTALTRGGLMAADNEGRGQLGLFLSYAIYAGLGLATLMAAAFRSRRFEPGAKLSRLIAWVQPSKDRRLWVLVFLGLIYGLGVEVLLPHIYPPSVDGTSLPQSPGQILTFGVLVVAVAPAIEEVLFRGWIYTSLKLSFGAALALLASSILFAGLHYDKSHVYALAVFPLGLVLGALREISGSIKPGIAFHAFYNFAVLLIGWLGGE